jgi:putative transposase
MRVIEDLFWLDNSAGVRRMVSLLAREGIVCNHKKVRRLMRLMCLYPVYQKPRTSIANKQDKKYPYLLKDLVINKPNQVWSADITYLPVPGGHLYLMGIIDWHSRKILSWKLSNSMDVSFCLSALQEAIKEYGKPEIFNTDQGSQFTSESFTECLEQNGVKISMDGVGRWADNIAIERFWRTLKYEHYYKVNPSTGQEVYDTMKQSVEYYNEYRPHSAHGILTPSEVYAGETEPKKSLLMDKRQARLGYEGSRRRLPLTHKQPIESEQKTKETENEIDMSNQKNYNENNQGNSYLKSS